MSRQISAAKLLERAQNGDSAAFRCLYDRYRIMIQSRIRDCLDGRLRTKVDIEDVTQEVWLCFFRHLREVRVANEQALRGLLRHLAACRTQDANRKFLGNDSRDVRRECFLSEDIPTRCSTPEVSVVFEDWWDSWLQFQPPRARAVLRMVRQGHCLRDIADALGLSDKTLRRLLDRAVEAMPP